MHTRRAERCCVEGFREVPTLERSPSTWLTELYLPEVLTTGMQFKGQSTSLFPMPPLWGDGNSFSIKGEIANGLGFRGHVVSPTPLVAGKKPRMLRK